MNSRMEVLLAAGDPALEQALEDHEALDAVARCSCREALVRSAASLRPQAAVVSLFLPGEMPWEEVFARLRVAGVRVVLLASGAGPGDPMLRQAVEVGVYDIVADPSPEAVAARLLSPATLRDALAWLPAETSANAPAARPAEDGERRYRRGRLAVAWSPKGGAGKTTVACELSYQAARAGQRVILLDFNMGNPEVAGRLGIFSRERGKGLNVLLQAGVTPERLVAVCQRAHGFLVLSPDLPGAGEGGFLDTTLEEAERVLDAALAVADLVVVDTATMMNDPPTYAALRRADLVLLLTEQAKTVTETAYAQARLLARLGQTPRLVVNKYDPEAGAGVRDIERFFSAPALAVIPHDRAGYLRAMQEGAPYSALGNGQARPWEVLASAVLGLPKHAPARRPWGPLAWWRRVRGR